MARPFYLIGHNTNSMRQIRAGLKSGLNAFEIDINRDQNGRLFVSHNRVFPHSPKSAIPPPPRLVPFLEELRALAKTKRGAGIALVIFDCKVNSAEHGARIVRAARTALNGDGVLLPVIYSVPKVDDARTFFQKVAGGLLPGEGLMIDQEASASEVASFFRDLNVAHACYGNGVTALAGIGLPTPNLAAQMDAAVALRALGHLRFVYPWVLVVADTMREFIRIGVNGVMVDTSNADRLVAVLEDAEFAGTVRAATRADDPFEPDASCVLQVLTKDTQHAETDARVEIELQLDNGSRCKRVMDGDYSGRFERGTSTYLTFWASAFDPSDVRSISVSHDGSRRMPDWLLDSITLRKATSADKVVAFDALIEKGVTVQRQC